MKKIAIVLSLIAVLLVFASCASTKSAEAPVIKEEVKEEVKAPEGCAYAGEYYVEFTSQDSPDPEPGEEFVVEADGTLHGAMEGSGLTGFEGTVNADGSFTAEYKRLGGTMSGTIADGKVTAEANVRGRVSQISGYIL